MANRFGVCGWYLPGEGPAAITMAGKLGFEGIQILDLGGSAQNYPLNDPRIQELYLAAMDVSGVGIHAIQSAGIKYGGGLRFPMASPEGELAIDNFKKDLAVCEALAIPTFLVASFEVANFRNDYEMANTVKMLAYFVELAFDKGVRVAWEPFCPTDKVLGVLDQVGGGLKLCYDSLNPIRHGTANPPDELRQIGIERIDCVHVKDAPENLIGCCPLGKGVGKFHETMGVLKELGYSGWIMAENYFYLPPMSNFGDGWDLAAADLAMLRDVAGQGAGW
ncbi:MAG: sugar phosphate isomerase/epimerase [Propionibacteriaceae bacterium]|jgi:sugar phosphate isomerase/epimerase|nr:sugar phosphate isomerase/epimerase [Propionibacteriaceae bacterium]